MSMLDRFCDVKHTFEGKALAVFLSFVLAFSMVSIAAFADPAVVGGESDASDAQIDDAPADAAGAGAPAPEQPTATGPASSASQADDPQPQADASESSAPAPEADGPVAELGVAVVGLEFSHAYLTYLDQAISLPADSLNVPLNKELVFAAHADEGCEIDAVKAIAAGVETVLEADEQTGEYKVPAEQVTSNLVLKLEASPAEADPSSSEAPAAQPLTSDTRIVDDEGRNEAAASGSEAPDAGDAVTVESDASEPAFEGYAQVDDVLVKVTAAAGILPEGTTVQAVRITSSAVIDAVEKAVEDHGKELDDIVAIDVTLLGPGGNVIQPDAAVNVCFFNAGISGDTLGVYHVANDGSSVSAVSARQADAVAQSFDVSHFSIYAVTAEGEPKLATYNFYDEDGALVETQIVKTGETLYEPELPEVAAGRFFQGWYAKSGNDWAEKFSAFGEQIVAETVTNDLYAKASEARYVYFMDDHGRVCTTKTGAEGDTVTADVTFPLAPNESVTGWYVDKELSHKVDSVTLEEDSVTLYPKVEHGSWMTFDAKGGSYTAPEFVSVGDVSVEPPEPMRAGYRFDGWYVDESYSGSSYRFGSTMGEDVTLHAKWKAAEANYSVVVWLEAADSTDEAPQYDYVTTLEYEGGTGETVPLPSAKDVKQRVDFTIDKKYVSDIDDGESDATVTIEGDGSSIANVRLNRVEFVIDLQCSTKKSSDKADYESAYQIKANYGADIAAQWSAATEAVNARYGTRVWVENPKNPGTTSNPVIAPFRTMTEDVVLYYVDNGSALHHLELYVEQAGNTKPITKTDPNFPKYNSGYRYSNNNPTDMFELADTLVFKGSGVHAEIPKYVNALNGFQWVGADLANNQGFFKIGGVWTARHYFERKSYTITFNNEGTVSTSEPIKYGTSIETEGSAPSARDAGVPEGSEFAGWYTSPTYSEGTEFDFSGATMPANNVVLYAKWILPTYRVTYYEDMAGTASAAESAVKYGETAIDEPSSIAHVPDGYKWVGWTTRSGSEGDFTYMVFNFDTQVYGDIDLYPYYINDEKRSVFYDANGGTGDVPTDAFAYAQGSFAKVASSELAAPTADQVFLGWNTQADGSGATYYPQGMVQLGDGDLTLYAQWGLSAFEASLTYDANDGTGTVVTETGLANNGEITLKTAMDLNFRPQTGVHFAGWNTEADGSGESFAGGAAARIDLDGNANVLYAQWALDEATVSVWFSEASEDARTFFVTESNTLSTSEADDAHRKVITSEDKSGYSSDEIEQFAETAYKLTPEVDRYVGYEIWVVGQNGVWKQIESLDGYTIENGDSVRYLVTAEAAHKVIYKAGDYGVGETYEEGYHFIGDALSQIDLETAGIKAADGYAFAGWRSDGVEVNSDGVFAMPGEDVTFTAQWEVDFSDLGAQGFEEFYDGEAHAVSLTGDVAGDEIAYAVTRGDGTTSAENAFVNVVDSAQVVVTVTRGGEQWTSEPVPATIKPLPVNIEVDNQTKSFNDPDPDFTGEVNGSLVGENDLGAVKFERAEADKGKENVGDVIALVASFTANPNYAVSVTEGTLTIVKSDALSVSATGYEGIYDGQSHGINVSTNVPADQVVIEYSADGGATWTEAAPIVRDVAERETFLVRASAPGYAPKTTESPVALAVAPIPVTVTAANVGKPFGDPDPDFEYTVDAVPVEGEALAFQGALAREAGEGVGDYAIERGSLALDDANGSFKATNYEVTVVPGVFTIRQTTGSVHVEKVWDNPGTAVGNPNIQIQLYRDGEPYGEAVTLPSGMTSHVFSNLPQGKSKDEAANGSGAYAYTVAETAIGGAPVTKGTAGVLLPGVEGIVKYTSTVEAVDGGFVIANKRTSVIVELAANITDRTIAHDESLAQTFSYRVGARSYTLGAGAAVKVAVDPGTTGVSVKANQNTWTTSYAVNGAPSKEGAAANVAAFADTKVSFDNERVPLRYYLDKKWYVDDGGQLPESLAFTVSQSTNQDVPNGSGVQVYQGLLSDWEPLGTIFQKYVACNELFPLADLKGTDYHYNAKEEIPDNYSEPGGGYTGWSAGDGRSDQDGVIMYVGSLDNYYAVTSVSGTKTWEDFGAEVAHDNATEVRLVLERSSDSGRTWQRVDAVPVWDGDRYTFGGLEKYTTPPFADRYRVTEQPVEGYYTVQDGTDFTNRAVRELAIVAGSRTWVYDGEAHAEDSYELTVDGGAPISVGADGVYAFPNGDVLSVEVEGAVTDVADTASGNNRVAGWTLVDADGNDISGAYRVTAQEGSLAIEPAGLSVSAENAEILYDGAGHGIAAAASVDDATVRYFNEATGAYDLEQPPAFRDAGVYEVRFQAARPNYTTAEGAATLTVKKRSVTLTSDDAEKLFDGAPLKAESVAVGGDGFAPGEGASYHGFASLVDADSIANEFSYELDAGTKADNYTVKTVPGTLTVHKAPLVVTVTGAQETARYDGRSHAVEGYAHDAGDKAVVALKEGALARVEGRDAGTHSMGLTADSFAVTSRNYEVTLSVVDGGLVIDPAEVLIAAADTGKRYGDDDPQLTAKVDGLAEGDAFNGSYTLARAVGEQAGSYPITVSDAVSNDPNYTVRTAPGTFTIAPAEGAAIVVLGGTKAYNGTPLESGGIMATGLAEGDSAEAVVRGSQTDVGTSEADVESYVIRNAEGQDVTANYANVAVVPGSLTVTPAAATIVVADAGKVAGAADPTFSGAVTGLVADGDLGEIAYSRTNADEAPGTYVDVLTAAYEENPNYAVTVVPGTFTIAAAPVAPTPADPTAPAATPLPPTPGTPPADNPLTPIVAPVADALAAAAETVIGPAETPLAGPDEQTIADNETPLAGSHAWCWVHWYIILGIIVTAVYAACVALRRGLFSHKLKRYEDDLTGGGDPAPGTPSSDGDAATPIAPQGAPLAAGLGE